MRRAAERYGVVIYVAGGCDPCSGAGSTWTRQVL